MVCLCYSNTAFLSSCLHKITGMFYTYTNIAFFFKLNDLWGIKRETVCAHARVMCKNECECTHLLHSRWDHVLLRRLQWWRFSAQDVSCSQSSCCLLFLPGDIRKVKEKDYQAQDNSETLTVMHSLTPTHSFNSFTMVICTGLDYI